MRWSEPARRALYLFVTSQAEPVSREQAAAAVGVPLHSAKFHLDRLVEEGLLDVEFRRLSGRTGPGAGRPSKLYRRSSRQLSVSLPERRYDLAGEVLASAIDRSTRDRLPVAEAVRETASEVGRGLAAEYVERYPNGATSRSDGDHGPLCARCSSAGSAGIRTPQRGRRGSPRQLPVRPACEPSTPSWSAA